MAGAIEIIVRSMRVRVRAHTYALLTLLMRLAGLRSLCGCELFGRRIGSTAGTPTRVSRSAIRADFTRTSSGESQPSDGVRFTSSSQGLRVSSIRMSNPKSSVIKAKRVSFVDMYKFY